MLAKNFAKYYASISQNYANAKLKKNFASKRKSLILLPPNNGTVRFWQNFSPNAGPYNEITTIKNSKIKQTLIDGPLELVVTAIECTYFKKYKKQYWFDLSFFFNE